MIQDAVTAEPLETRLAAVIETATPTYLEALDGEDRATAKLCVQEVTQAAENS